MSVVAGFVALGLCVPLIVVGFAARWAFMREMLGGDGRRGGGRPRRPTPPPGRDPYHLP